jgi:hypothetical protein
MNPKLEETIILDIITSSSTGAAADADSTPTCEVFEDATDTAILTPTVTKRTSKTGNYRVPVACTAANGFEAGKSYNVVATATVGSVVAKGRIASFQVRAESVDDLMLAASYTTPLSAAGVRSAVGLASANLDTQLAGNLAAIQNVQNNTFIATSIPQFLERPDSGSVTVNVSIVFSDETGAAKNLDSGSPAIALVNDAGTDLSGRLGSITNPATGKYVAPYTSSASDAVEGLHWDVTGTVNSKVRRMVAYTQVVDTTAVDFTSSDRTKLNQLATDYTTARAGKLDNLDAAVTTRLASSSYTAPDNTDVVTILNDVHTGAGAIYNLLNSGTFGLSVIHTQIGTPMQASSYTAPPSAATIATTVRDVDNTSPASGSLGAKVNSAASAGDPWATALPGSYSAGTAGAILGGLAALIGGVAAAVWTVTNRTLSAFGFNVNLNLTQAVPNTNTPGTVGDALNAARAQGFGKWMLSGTALTLYGADGTTVVRVFTLDSATAPTSRT